MDNSPDMLTWMLIMACVGSGMMGGLFSAFSSFMMKAMSSLPDAEGIRAMQAINRFIVRPGFLFVFLGTGVLCLATAVMGFNIAGIAAPAMAATALYLLACIVSTIVFNIPLNNQLDAADPESLEGHAVWRRYLVSWTRWNHLRSVATVTTTILLAYAIASR